MRGARSTLVMLVVFLGLGAYVYFVEMERRPAAETPPNEQLFELEADDVETLTIRTASDETTISRTDNAWSVTDPVASSADDATVGAITSELSTLEIRRVVDDAPTDLEPFGLDSPTVDISFSTAGADTIHRLLLGETTPTGADRYAKLASEDRVLLVPASAESALRKSTFDLRDKTILDFETADVDRLEINSAGSVLEFEKSNDEWRITQPWDVRADFGTVEGLVGRMSSGQMLSVASEDVDVDSASIEDAEESDPYGLNEPSVTATVRAGSAEARLVVGSQAPDGQHYSRDASRSMVFTIEGSLGSDLTREPLEYRRKDLFTFRSFNATRLEIERSEATAAFEKAEAAEGSTETTWTTIEPENGTAETIAVEDLLAKVSNLRAESFTGSRSEVGLSDGDIIATVRVTFGDEDTEERVVLWRIGDDTYAVNGDEPGAGVVDTRSVDDAFEALDALLAPAS